MVSRESLRERAGQLRESLAGTVGDAADGGPVPAHPLLGGSASDDVGPQIPPLFPEADDEDDNDDGPRLPF